MAKNFIHFYPVAYSFPIGSFLKSLLIRVCSKSLLVGEGNSKLVLLVLRVVEGSAAEVFKIQKLRLNQH